MRMRIIIKFLLILLIFESNAEESKKQTKANILFLLSDQHRGDYLEVNGNGWIFTPNLDKLADEGVDFQKAYTSTSSLTPARTVIYTGLSPWNPGILGYMGGASHAYQYKMPSFFIQNGYTKHDDRKYKYIYTLSGEKQLFDFENDPFELKNLIQFKNFQSIHKKWYDEMVNHLKKRGSHWVDNNKLMNK